MTAGNSGFCLHPAIADHRQQDYEYAHQFDSRPDGRRAFWRAECWLKRRYDNVTLSRHLTSGARVSSPTDLKTIGLKATLPRLRILELFEKSDVRHLSAEEVYKILLKEGTDTGLATVYRVLTQFEQAGLLVRHHFESDKAVFELEPRRPPRPSGVHAMRARRGVLRRSDRKAPDRGCPGTRLRHPRAFAASVRGLHEAELPEQE